MKKIMISIFILYVITMCTNCKTTVDNNVAEQQCKQVIEYFNNRDAESLKNMFCEEIKQSHDLDKEIDIVFNAFDGEITSYKLSTSGGGEDMDNGEITRLEIGPVIQDIKTSYNKDYEISFNSYIIYKKKNMEGMLFLYLFDEFGNRYDIGEYIY